MYTEVVLDNFFPCLTYNDYHNSTLIIDIRFFIKKYFISQPNQTNNLVFLLKKCDISLHGFYYLAWYTTSFSNKDTCIHHTAAAPKQLIAFSVCLLLTVAKLSWQTVELSSQEISIIRISWSRTN